MKKKVKSFTALLLTVSLLSSCTNASSIFSSSKESDYEEFITVDVFDTLANFEGIQSGWFAKIVKDKFNMQLNIIAPNVSGGGETLFENRTAAGNLGDLIICSGENGTLQDLVDANLLYNMSGYIEDKNIIQYKTAIDSLNSKVDQEGIWAIPSEVSSSSATTPNAGLDLTYGPYLRWDLYAQLGYPALSTLEDLLPVLKDMQALCPESESGNKTYAFSFFKDWDGNLMNNVKQPTCFYGYDEWGFVLAKADGSSYQSIVDSDSEYVRVLKFYFDANQLGLVDPESRNQNYESVFKKYEDGSVLFSFWPWLCKPAFNSTIHLSENKALLLAPIRDMQIFAYGCVPTGNHKIVMAIGNQAEDPERLMDFIDWLYSPEGITLNGAQAADGTAGPEGLTWELTEDGPALTEYGWKALYTIGTLAPDELGGGLWSDGVSALNYQPVSKVDLDPYGYPYYYTLWDSFIEADGSLIEKDWSEKMGGANSGIEYLKENDMMIVAPGSSYVAPEESKEIATIRSQCRTIIVRYSWDMIFAEDEETFNKLLKEMQNYVKDIGYEQVLSADMASAKIQNDVRIQAALEFPEQ